MTDKKRNLKVLITGANRGLGLEFARQFLAAGDEVFAGAREPEGSSGLSALKRAHPDRLHLVRIEVTDGGLVDAARDALEKAWDRVDVLLNNAGTYGSRDSSMHSLQFDEARRVFEINTLGPLRVARTFAPLLRRGESPRLVNITSLMGSIKDNTSGGAWSYRISKAALNMLTRNMAHELSALGVVAVAMHPGWVRTDMGGEGAPLSVEEAVGSMVATIRSLGRDLSGAFIDRDGNRLEW